ncbi:NACHT, LRR and PYD domains-containing protein 1 homolog isoform X2 [Paramisgurnus dabryanus]|uniref:NACHT, LRR and PYD domains-containing protein 1 homolog isoform X2 n=1 Tax=Paramisgurnus dabryanus TaxID=90735 RepID=UPI003CCF3341
MCDSKLTPDKLSMILPALQKCEKIYLDVENPTDSDLIDLMCAVTGGQTQSIDVHSLNTIPADEHCSVESLHLSISNEASSVRIGFCYNVVRSLGLTLPRSEAIDWAKLFQIFHKTDLDAFTSAVYSVPKLKRLELEVGCLNESLSVWTLSISQNCHSVKELKIQADFLLDEGIKVLQRSRTRPNCAMTFTGFKCNNKLKKCTLHEERDLSCNQQLKISVNCRGFADETLRRPLFWD